MIKAFVIPTGVPMGRSGGIYWNRFLGFTSLRSKWHEKAHCDYAQLVLPDVLSNFVDNPM